jgi:hypothetical protein
VLAALFRRKLRLIITVDGITDIITEGITTDITITAITIGTGIGLSASVGARGIIAIGNRIILRSRLRSRRRSELTMRRYALQ